MLSTKVTESEVAFVLLFRLISVPIVFFCFLNFIYPCLKLDQLFWFIVVGSMWLRMKTRYRTLVQYIMESHFNFTPKYFDSATILITTQ